MKLFEFDNTIWLENDLSPRFRGRLSLGNDMIYKSELSFENTELNLIYDNLTNNNFLFKKFESYWNEVFLDLFSNDVSDQNYWLYAAHFGFVSEEFIVKFKELIKNELDKHPVDKKRISHILYKFNYLR